MARELFIVSSFHEWRAEVPLDEVGDFPEILVRPQGPADGVELGPFRAFVIRRPRAVEIRERVSVLEYLAGVVPHPLDAAQELPAVLESDELAAVRLREAEPPPLLEVEAA